MHFSWSKTPFPGQIECFVAVLLTSEIVPNFGRFSLSQILGGRPSKSYTHFITPVVLMFFIHVFNVFFIKVKNMFFYVFIWKSMFLTSMQKSIK